MVYSIQKAVVCRHAVFSHTKGPAFLVLWAVWLLTVGISGNAFAFSTSLKYSTEDQGKREILSFHIPPGANRPHMELVDLQTLRVTVPGVLALPAYALDTERTRWISSFDVEGILDGELGINVFLGLKTVNLSFRDSLGEMDPIMGTPYRLEIDQLPTPSASKETKILEGRILPGRDGTLVIISYIGPIDVAHTLEFETHVVRLRWKNASLAPSWRPIKPKGLAERLMASFFPKGQGRDKDLVEMELLLNGDATKIRKVEFYKDAEAGLFIIELPSKYEFESRENEALALLHQRKMELANGLVLPLNRLDPIFTPRSDVTLELQGKSVSESFFMENARDAAKDHKFAMARAYLDRLLQHFHDTPNRELVKLYKWELANSMNWKPGWLLAELDALLAEYPNTKRYPHYRLAQLRLMNRATYYENAAAILQDPNLPKGDPRVELERGYTAMGLAHSGLNPSANWQTSEKHLRKALELSHNTGDVSAEANYLLARMAHERYTAGGQEAAGGQMARRVLDGLSSEQMARIANHPEWLMNIGDIYYGNRLYPQAFKIYSQFITNYPGMTAMIPWAILHAAESSREMSLRVPGIQNQKEHRRDATRLFRFLQYRYPDTDEAAWGQIFQLRMDETTDLAKRLEKLDAVIKKIALPEVLSEALKTKADILGKAKQYRKALNTLNTLLSLSSRSRWVTHAKKLKRDYLIAGMQEALKNDSPEKAILLAELHGENWREDPTFIPARVALAEALLRLGLWTEGLKFLHGLSSPETPGLTQLAQDFSKGVWPEISVSSAFASLTSSSAGNRLDDTEREALSAIGESVPTVREGIAMQGRDALHALEAGFFSAESPGMDTEVPVTEIITKAEARVRLDQASRLLGSQTWEGILNLLEQLPDTLLHETGQARRLRLMSKAEAGLYRYPQAVGYMESLLSGQEVANGDDYYQYATLLQKWKGDTRAQPVYERVSEEAKNKEIQSLAHIQIGDIMQRSGNFKTAVTHYRQAATLSPTTSWAKVATENASQLELAMEEAQ